MEYEFVCFTWKYSYICLKEVHWENIIWRMTWITNNNTIQLGLHNKKKFDILKSRKLTLCYQWEPTLWEAFIYVQHSSLLYRSLVRSFIRFAEVKEVLRTRVTSRLCLYNVINANECFIGLMLLVKCYFCDGLSINLRREWRTDFRHAESWTETKSGINLMTSLFEEISLS